MSDLLPTLPMDGYEGRTLGWLLQAVEEGEAILKSEPAYHEIDQAIAYIMGSQGQEDRPMGLSKGIDNRAKHIVLQTVAALTDIKPLFGFKTSNPQFQTTNDVLDRLSRAWWVNTFADLALADVLRYAAGPGTGFCAVEWDPSMANGQGDIRLTPWDPRDVLPIRPRYGMTLQDWEGVTLRTSKTVNELRAKYPGKVIEADRGAQVAAAARSKWKRIFSQIVSPSAVDVANQQTPKSAVPSVPTVDVFYTYLKDRTLHIGDRPITMGDPQTSYAYTVYPLRYPLPDGRLATEAEARLYPRGRLIVWTRKSILWDGPNPFWHGLFPVARLTLDPWPWSLLGVGLMKDLIPLQDLLNEFVQGTADKVRKVLRPGIEADKKLVPEGIWQRLDTRLAGMKLKTNPAAGKGINILQEPDLPNFVMEVIKLITTEMDYHADVANLQALAQLQQTPGADSIERLQEALSPVLRMKSRLMELFLREIGEMVKGNFFQFYNMPRRIQLLGDAGMTFQDFDFDPGTLVPSYAKTEAGYVPELDATRTRAERAGWYHKQFTFQITPNSLLAMTQVSRKMLYLQLRRLTPNPLIDRWTLYETLEIPNGGAPPGDVTTITQRLQAEQDMFPPVAPPAVGRPPSGQEMPQLQVKPDEQGIPRLVVSESGGGGPNPA